MDMLVALTIELRKKRGLWQRLLDGGRGTVASRFMQILGVRYLLITAEPDRKGKLDWQEIRRIACGESGRMVLPAGMVPPADSGIRPFAGGALQRAMMQTTAHYLLRTATIAPHFRRIGIYDPQARMPYLASLLMPQAGDVQVVTNRPEAYSMQEQLVMEAYGATLPVSDNITALDNAHLILAPDGMNGVYPRTRGIILSGVMEKQRGVVGGYVLEVSKECLEAIPAGCDVWTFLSGLYERSDAKQIASHPPLMLQMGGQNISLRDAAWKLSGLDISISV